MPEQLGTVAGAAVATIVALSVLYTVVRFAVRDGYVDAQRRLERTSGPRGVSDQLVSSLPTPGRVERFSRTPLRTFLDPAVP
ncbi:hypothetical protein [Nocardioides sp. SYSU DS0663]|uniref:hypothetical protein n=1 Tax=Nocardioides sp. SYSU DS0663 TaxID=3416445 RepID=UPI003F4BC99F